jgi:four helix bundle protein
MAKIERFEDIEAWKKARVLTKRVYELTDDGQMAREFTLKDQMRRSAISIMANIAEGFEREGDKEFRQFLAIAKGSVGELKAHLYVALDSGMITAEKFSGLMSLADETSRLLAGFMKYLKQSPHQGSKFK